MSEILIEDDVEEKVLERIEQTNFETTTEYVNFVLREVLECGTDTGDDEASQIQEIEEQMEDLGYI